MTQQAQHHAPTAEEFLAQPEPDEDEGPAFGGYVGVIQSLPPDPMTRIADTLEALVGMVNKHAEEEGEADRWRQEYDDLDAKYGTMLEVIADVEAALGKSKAAPALAAKAVIEAWKNPTVPPAENQAEVDAAVAAGEIVQPDLPSLADMDVVDEVEGHTRVEHDEQTGHFFCRDCTLAKQEWVGWPCPAVSGEAGALVTSGEGFTTVQQPVQPAHNAPVEEWREYARALGFAGPEIDKANRSVIRTTLGIAQPTSSD